MRAKNLTLFEVLVAVAGVIGAVYLVNRCTSSNKPGPEASAATVAETPRIDTPREPAPPTKAECVISMPGNDDEVPMLPTEQGFDEFAKIVARTEDGNEHLAVFRANGGFYVASGTKCSPIETGLVSSQVRVLEGRHAGKAGWLPNEWRLGK